MLVLFAIALLTACANGNKVITYPNVTTLSFAVSTGTVDVDTEVPVYDYLIPQSQVFVSGRDSKVASAVGSGFGLIGLAASIGINRGRNAAGLDGTEELFRLNFASSLREAFQFTGEKRSQKKYAPAPLKAVAALTLIPSARFNFREQEDAYVSHHVKVNFVDPALGEATGKEFLYVDFQARNMLGSNGWAEEGAKAFKAAGYKALPILAEIIQDDIDGKLMSTAQAAATQVRELKIKSLTAEPFRVAVLREYPDEIAVARFFGGNISNRTVLIYERSAIELKPVKRQ